MNKKILILGANSDIAKYVITEFAILKFDLILCYRKDNQLNDYIDLIKKKFSINIQSIILDLEKLDLNEINPKINDLYGIISFAGYLGSQEIALSRFEEVKKIISINFINNIKVIEYFKNKLTNSGNEFIAAVTSVAGSRGRKSNFYYGSAKAALTTYLSGLRFELKQKNINVITIIPGFVKTKMIKDYKTPKLLTISPERFSKKIVKNIFKKKSIIYQDFSWLLIDFIIKFIPEMILKKINF